jgi:hypothetical protein
MIYSRFGTILTPVSKERDGGGQMLIHVTVEGGIDTRSYAVKDLMADDGMPEINDTVAKLPWRAAPVRTTRGSRIR